MTDRDLDCADWADDEAAWQVAERQSEAELEAEPPPEKAP